MTALHQPDCCTICGYYLTTIETYTGNRCIDPGHWQAAGLLSPRDFYSMAQIAALARVERHRRPGGRPASRANGSQAAPKSTT